MTTLETAQQLHTQGMSPIPISTDGTKRPDGAWKHYQKTRATLTEIATWFTNSDRGLGVVTGAVSGNLEMLEIEARAAHRIPELAQLAHNSGLANLWDTITTGWCEQSPSGGYHWFYRLTTPVPGNTKIARNTTGEVTVETRGEGGQTVIAPSTGPVHPTGRPWILLNGGPTTVPTISLDEREALHAIFKQLDETPPPPTQDDLFTNHVGDQGDGLKPGDDFENRTSWDEILTPHGWVNVTTRGQTRYWRRPGKNLGFSATTGHANDRDRLYVWTSSTDFTPETPYTKFGAHTLLNHAGDHSAAAAQLRKDGYGTPPSTEQRTKPRTITLTPTPTPAPATDGALATVTQLQPRPQPITLTDHGNAQLLINRHGNKLRYAPSRGKWLAWDNTRWDWQEDDGPAIEATWETIQAITPNNDTERTHKHKSLSRKSLEAATALARRDHRIRVNADQLDNEPYTLNTPNGLINLKTGHIEPHNPDRLHTKITATPYNPNHPTPLWNQFLTNTFQEHPEITPYIQALAGYAATGQVTHHILPFLHGSGGNGKSVFLDTLVAILGDYATTAPAGFLMAGREQHETEIARLAGTRLVVCSEINQNSKFDEAKVKLLTGGDKLTARFMRQDHFSFTPTHTLFLMGNHQPKVEAGGESFWRRLRMLPFTTTIPENKQIENLAQRLITEEGPGILAWIIQGAITVTSNGLTTPETVLASTDRYATEEDALARFITDHVTLGGGNLARVNTAHMRTTYTAWCRSQGEKELSPQVFGRELRTRYDVTQERSNGKRFYTNLVLTDLDELDEEQAAEAHQEHWADR